MIGLIKKDLFIVARSLRSLLVVIMVFSILALNGKSEFSFFCIYMSIAIMMSTFSYDEFNKSDAFIVALPNGKTNAVKAKYVATLIIEIIALIFSFILSVIGGIIGKNLDILELIELSLYTLSGVLLTQAIFYPLIYKFGVEKGRIGIFISIFSVAILGNVITNGLNFKLQIPNNVLTMLDVAGVYIFPMIVLGLLVLSYFLSKRIYSKKEF